MKKYLALITFTTFAFGAYGCDSGGGGGGGEPAVQSVTDLNENLDTLSDDPDNLGAVGGLFGLSGTLLATQQEEDTVANAITAGLVAKGGDCPHTEMEGDATNVSYQGEGGCNIGSGVTASGSLTVDPGEEGSTDIFLGLVLTASQQTISLSTPGGDLTIDEDSITGLLRTGIGELGTCALYDVTLDEDGCPVGGTLKIWNDGALGVDNATLVTYGEACGEFTVDQDVDQDQTTLCITGGGG